MSSFESTIEVRWSDCDLNRHVRHSAYYDYGAHTRMQFFLKIGFNTAKMEQLQIGPILFKEECTFIKELKLEDVIQINLSIGQISPDGSRWVLHHEIFNAAGEKCAHISVKGAWIDLVKRKLTAPPTEILNAFDQLPKGEPYEHRSQKG